ncbi:MAG: ExeA family protein [Fimbriiglobus sp.]
MDFARWGLTARPFRPAPDTQLYTCTATHEATQAALHAAYRAGESLALVDGEPGLGKSITALRFLESLPESTLRFYIPSARFRTPTELFQTILFDTLEDYHNKSEHELRLAVTDLILKRLPSEQPMVMVFDEAQHLNAELLEELRLLTNLASRSRAGCLLVLVALPSLRLQLAKSEYAAFTQRLAVRARIEALTVEESVDYITAQLKLVGDKRCKTVSEEAMQLAADACRGVPRLLNQALSAAFSLSEEAGEKQVDAEAMLGALTQMGLVTEDHDDDLPKMKVPFATPRPQAHRPSEMAVPAAESRTQKPAKKRKAG